MKKQMNLGELIHQLEMQPQENDIRFDFGGLNPSSLSSYRGDYSHLAIQFEDAYPQPKVGDVLKLIKSAVGKSFEGYKGGEYIMALSTPVWVAAANSSSGTAIHKVKNWGWCTMLKTFYID